MSSLSAASRLIRPVAPRDPAEPHRASSSLELLTDLCFVVAVAQAALALHHGIVSDHIGHAVLAYGMSFFAIWWAWINFAWFGSAYDNDDLGYRLLTILQIIGVLILAAGVHRVGEGDIRLVVVGYLIMRVGLVVLWLRAARGDAERRRTCLRYAGGIVVTQLLWVSLGFGLPFDSAPALPLFFLLVVVDLLVPVQAEQAGRTPWHAHHITDRFGAFFIIVLGEVVLAATTAFQELLDGGEQLGAGIRLMGAAVLIVFGMWWTYFEHDATEGLRQQRIAFIWGYGHFFVYAAAAAAGAGLVARVEYLLHPEEVSARATAAAITIPVAIFVLAAWTVHLRVGLVSPRSVGLMVGAAVLILASTLLPAPELITGLIVAALVGFQILSERPAADRNVAS